MHRNEVTNLYYRIKCGKKEKKPQPNVFPRPSFTFIIPWGNGENWEAIVLIRTVSISSLYAGVNFHTRPSKLHESYGRQSIYKQFLPAQPCPALSSPQLGPGHRCPRPPRGSRRRSPLVFAEAVNPRAALPHAPDLGTANPPFLGLCEGRSRQSPSWGEPLWDG